MVERIIRSNYLAQISGGKATWVAAIGDHKHRRAVAVVAQEWKEPRFIADPNRSISDYLKSEAAKGVFFEYHGQVDPEKVLGIS